MTTTKETRIIRGTTAGYEDSYTQYVISYEDGDEHGELWITQIALRDNMARVMQAVEPVHKFGPVEGLRRVVDSLIENRLDHSEEVVA